MLPFEIIRKTAIDKGWSGDRKYCITASDGNIYLLRTAPIHQLEQKKAEFFWMQQVELTGIPMCRALHLEETETEVHCIHSWIDGRDAEQIIPTLPEKEQYNYGCQAGQYLRKIHSLPAPGWVPEWEMRFNQKTDRKIRMYQECPLQYEGGQAFIDYLNSHRHLLKNRPLTFQHGDFHIGNMMIDADGKLVIIDFNRFDFGDPWEEFNRIVWCGQKAPPFAAGMVDGYFNGNVPQEFWELLALYISSNALSSLPWAIPFGEEEIAVMQKQGQDILNWYDCMNTTIPIWYRKYAIKNQTAL
ncbi:MAG: phosphotransferase [Clostridia bacterium]|nr:phosphotransferase [Clostridia bacterium]